MRNLFIKRAHLEETLTKPEKAKLKYVDFW